MTTIAEINKEFNNLKKIDDPNLQPIEIELKNLSMILFFWIKQINTCSDRTLKRHCLKQKIKIMNDINKKNKYEKDAISKYVEKQQQLEINLNKFMVNQYNDKLNNLIDSLNTANVYYKDSIKENYSEEAINSIKNPNDFLLHFDNLKSTWEEYIKTDKYSEIIKDTPYDKYQNYMCEKFDNNSVTFYKSAIERGDIECQIK